MNIVLKCAYPGCQEPFPTFYGTRRVCKSCLRTVRQEKYKNPEYKAKLLSRNRSWAKKERETNPTFRAKEQARHTAWVKSTRYEHRGHVKASRRNQ